MIITIISTGCILHAIKYIPVEISLFYIDIKEDCIKNYHNYSSSLSSYSSLYIHRKGYKKHILPIGSITYWQIFPYSLMLLNE